MNLSKDAKKIIDESVNQEELNTIILFVKDELDLQQVSPTELQWTILINHLNEMIIREKNKEILSGIDINMFTEISEDALSIAEKVTNEIGDLPIEEKYLLSIHFENAK